MLTPLRRAMLAATAILMSATAMAQISQDPFTPVADDSLAIVSDEAAMPPFRYGYISYSYALKAMPGYAEAQRSIDALKARYDEEAKRAESEFNDKYEEFLEGQRDFPLSILQKRQAELQELLSKNMAFREESRRLLAQAEGEIMAPLKSKLSALLRKIGEQNGYAFILNTDGNACLYMDMGMADDVTLLFTDQLRLAR